MPYPSRVPATTFRRVAPVFATTDLARALAHYKRLGFVVEAYDNADYYGYACRDGIEIHLAQVDSLDRRTTTSCAYLWVDDAAALHNEWAGAGIDGRLEAPTSTEYGLLEGSRRSRREPDPLRLTSSASPGTSLTLTPSSSAANTSQSVLLRSGGVLRSLPRACRRVRSSSVFTVLLRARWKRPEVGGLTSELR